MEYLTSTTDAARRKRMNDALQFFHTLMDDPRARIETLEVSAGLGDPLATRVAAPGAMATTYAHRFELRVILEVPPQNHPSKP